ncbi:MAG: hypothetical protein FWF81_05200 [Defluviitaleaceae bacterium]|nr:hypothetical protein [Defluviitaleaceae bacterium]
MAETFRKLRAENKKLLLFLALLIALGVIFLLAERFMGEPLESFSFYADNSYTIPYEEETLVREGFQPEQILENRLEEFFSMVEGAGQVRVMISPLGGRETVFAVDANVNQAYSTEQDGQGGTRETRNYQTSEKIVMITDRQGTDIPLVIREIEPRIEGIAIIAEGGECPFVRDALTRAARAMLGLEAHNIQILTMAK